ncbi:hypothetical protein M378DRAFT_11774 [Amanita muscaria Koide BX008]|uniref:Ribonuclease H1 N-terminal domain-containing protein n=1 Tax=Amanita muscaria (strain Koide BX008) TaxID=946122 RepID=A0A0C2WQW6_AMAMK|nr:hypothetical protein M378DRAFT_11774 [Amanita muscaria Koide BX008]
MHRASSGLTEDDFVSDSEFDNLVARLANMPSFASSAHSRSRRGYTHYVVTNGRRNGIYQSWSETQEQQQQPRTQLQQPRTQQPQSQQQQPQTGHDRAGASRANRREVHRDVPSRNGPTRHQVLVYYDDFEAEPMQSGRSPGQSSSGPPPYSDAPSSDMDPPYFVVLEGQRPGVYESYTDAIQAMGRFGGSFHSFYDQNEAYRYFGRQIMQQSQRLGPN